MNAAARRQFLQRACSLAAVGALPRTRAGGDGTERQVRSAVRNANVLDPSQSLSGKRDIGIRYGQIESIAPTIAAERGARVMDAGGKLVTPGLIDLHCHSYPVRLGDRHPGRRAGRAPVHDDRRLGGRRRREQLRRVPPLHRAGVAHAPVRVRAHRGRRAGRLSGARALQHRLRPARGGGACGRRERRHRARRQGAHERERDRAPRPRAAAARDQGVRDVGRAGQGDVPHRRRRRPAR